MTFFFGLAALMAGAWLGLELPDADQRTALLLHRSAITHGPLIPLFVFLAARGSRATPLRLFAMGLCLGYLVHLAFDLFPSGWSGYALISIPVYGWLPGVLSATWIAVSLTLCAYWAVHLVQSLRDYLLVLLGSATIFTVAVFEEHSLLGPLASTAAAVALASAVAAFQRPRHA